MTTLPVPDDLGERAAQLWTGVTGKYELRVDELFILEAACREVDLIDDMVDRQRYEDLIGKGSMGQDVAAPLVSELRQHRATFAALMRQLKLPDDTSKPGLSASESARRAANARWGNAG